ncbi:MAG: hypothetical protein IJL69_00265 [Oscillospiraceae bacterium]|nr:hypothetical protein [Oscillospiraceae bacterium]
MNRMYFVDGYHGGIQGHMPVGSWQDILGALERRPEWTVSLDVEPASYEWLRRNDREVYLRLRDFACGKDTAGRLEFLNGAYAQPFNWAISGESTVRQLRRGISVIEGLFPGTRVDTYAVQEPCFTSQLPQILRGLGFERMSLKNSTCWGGYMARMPGGIVRLHAPDGTWIPAVVRYACEELYDCCATDASGYDRENVHTLADRCAAMGIPAANGMTFQDLGWLAHPMVEGEDIEYLTYREYFRRFGDRMEGDVDFSQEDVLCALPWGTPELTAVTRRARALERELPRIEKLCMLADSLGVLPARAAERLADAWDALLWCQHHDAYICAMSPRWQEFVRDRGAHAGEIAASLKADAVAAMTDLSAGLRPAENEICLGVFSTMPQPDRDCVSIRLGLPQGWRGARVFDPEGREVPSCCSGVNYSSFGYDANGVLLPGDPVPKPRLYPDGSEEALDLTFVAETRGIGCREYRVELTREPRPFEGMATVSGDRVDVVTDVWEMTLDLSRGGAITRLRERADGTEWVEPDRPLGYLRGFFHKAGRLCDSMEQAASVRVLENTSLRTVLAVSGTVGGHAFTNVVRVTRTGRRIDFVTSVDFRSPERVGDPEMPPENAPHNYRRRAGYNEELKLAVAVPFGNGDDAVFKGAPYDVCRSRLGSGTSFIDWGEIRHNIVNDWIDVCSADETRGVAVLSDRVNGYSFRDGLLTMTVGFGSFAGFFWGDYELTGRPELCWSLFPHRGNALEACVEREFARAGEPMFVARLAGAPDTAGKTVFSTDDGALTVTGAIPENGGWSIRLFSCREEPAPLRYTCALAEHEGKKCDLWGRPADRDPHTAGRFEIITLR